MLNALRALNFQSSRLHSKSRRHFHPMWAPFLSHIASHFFSHFLRRIWNVLGNRLGKSMPFAL